MSEDDIIKMQADAGRNPDDWTGIEKALLAELIAARAEVEEVKAKLQRVTQYRDRAMQQRNRKSDIIAELSSLVEGYKQQNAQQAAEIRRLTGLLNGNPEEEA